MRIRLRTALALTAVATVGIAGSAVAAPAKKAAAPVCNLITDEKGDGGGVFPYSDSLDIVSADIASNAKLVTAAIRVAKYTASDSDTAPTGRAWYLEFMVPSAETPLWLGAQVTPTGTLFRYGWVDGSIRRSLGAVEGKIDEAKNELRITAPIGAWAERGSVKPGAKVSSLTAASYNFVGAAAAGGSLQPGDDAAGNKTYIGGTASCVKPGS